MRHLPRLTALLYAQPWLITSMKYEALRTQFRAALKDGSLTRLQMRAAKMSEENDDDHDEPDGDEFPTQLQRRADMDCLSCLEIEDGIAIVPVSGILGKHLGLIEMLCGGYDLETLNAQCLALMNRADVRTVVFHFNTPGGAAQGVADSAQCMLDLAATGRRTIAYCDEACSGGMWLAAACDEIICGQSSAVGSISALCAILDESKAFEMDGLQMQVFTDGTLKGAGIEGTSLTPAQRDDIQGRVDHIGGMFKDFMRSRRSGIADADMQGQWFYGDQALAKGLVDSIQPSLKHCIASLL